jgi:parallel beta-helix repeat protein
MNSTYCEINNSYFEKNGKGISLWNSSNNQINNCVFFNNSFGINLERCSNNIIKNCTFSKGRYGVRILRNSLDNSINGCNIMHQDESGIIISKRANRNRIYFNNFISNSYHAIDNGSENYWDNGKGGGNYWDNYTGLDNGTNYRPLGDGIGDTNIPHIGLDFYPFIEKDGWLDYEPVDTDNDNIPDILDNDIDGDGYPNENDYYPYDESKWKKEEQNAGLHWLTIVIMIIIITIIIGLFSVFIIKVWRKKA